MYAARSNGIFAICAEAAFLLLLLLKRSRVVARAQSGPDGPLASLVRLMMGEAPAGVNWPRYENPHQAAGSSAKGAPLGLLPLLGPVMARAKPVGTVPGFATAVVAVAVAVPAVLHWCVWIQAKKSYLSLFYPVRIMMMRRVTML